MIRSSAKPIGHFHQDGVVGARAEEVPVVARGVERAFVATAAREIARAGYDYLKIYDGLSLEVYNTFIEEGKALGIPLDGHIPRAVGIERVVAAGQTLEHLDKISVAVAGHPPPMAKLEDARQLFTGKSAWVTPTLASLRVLDRAGSPEYTAGLEKPEMAYVDSSTMGWWRSLAGSGTRQATSSPMYQFEVGLLKVLRETGTNLLAGTDAANPLMVAGFSLHDELRALVEDGGMSRYEALLTATRNPARFLGDSLGGAVRVGARADLLLVDGNPLTDLAALRRPLGVMVGGRWMDRSRLDAMLASAIAQR